MSMMPSELRHCAIHRTLLLALQITDKDGTDVAKLYRFSTVASIPRLLQPRRRLTRQNCRTEIHGRKSGSSANKATATWR